MGKKRAAAASDDGSSVFPSPNTAPWLVIPYGKGTPRKQAFCNIMCKVDKSRTFIKSIPELIAKTYIQKPSHQGWLIITCDDEKYDYSTENYKFGDCFLWNPATSKTIRLPSLLNWCVDSSGYCFVDCVLSSAPGGDGTDKSLVLFIFSYGAEGNCELVFLYCIPGDKKWTKQKNFSKIIPVEDMQSLHYFNKKFYLMCTGDLNYVISTVWNCDGSSLLTLDYFKNKVQGMGLYPAIGGNNTSLSYTFVATEDELYCVPVTYTLRGFRKVIIHIEVMRLDLDTMEWKGVHSIGDHVLFLGSSPTTSACCSAAEMGLAMGCLYLTLTDDQCIYKFDIGTTGISVVGPHLEVPKPWKGLEFITMSCGGRRGESMVVGKDEAVHPYIPREPIRISNLSYPWLMSCQDRNFNTFSIINSNSKDSNHQRNLMVLPVLRQTVIRFQKGGWLLVSMEDNEFGLFFYNPFTRETIELPELPVGYTFSSSSFSSSPTSPDCVVFAIEQGELGQVRIYFIRKGENSWSSCPFTKKTSTKKNSTKKYMPSHNAPVFYNGKFYSVDYNGSLGVFIAETNTWKVLEKPDRPFDGIYPSFLVEWDGKLLLVKLGRLGTLVGIFRLDFSLMDWVQIEDLGRHVLFVSYTSCFSLVAPDSSMENKVYFPRLCMKGGVLFYCLKTGSYQSFGSGHSASDFTDTEGWFLNCTWIQPNLENLTDQELQWVKCPSRVGQLSFTGLELV